MCLRVDLWVLAGCLVWLWHMWRDREEYLERHANPEKPFDRGAIRIVWGMTVVVALIAAAILWLLLAWAFGL